MPTQTYNNTAVIRYENPIDFTVVDGQSFSKGDFAKLVTPRTLSGAALIRGACAGIIARDKVASDGRTQLAVFRRGVFRGTANDTIVAGSSLEMGDNGSVRLALAGTSGAKIIGTALQGATSGAEFEFELNIG